MVASIAGLFVLGFGLLLAAAPHHYRVSKTELFGLGTGILALTLGMRHAFDADHISAIDNTTRKLMAEGKRPLSVGFFFSLGHSTVVLVLAVVLNFGIRTLDAQVKQGSSGLHVVTGIIGTLVSRDLLVPHRGVEPRHLLVHHEVLPGDAKRSLRRGGARAPAPAAGPA